jgi:hypothetical protein
MWLVWNSERERSLCTTFTITATAKVKIQIRDRTRAITDIRKLVIGEPKIGVCRGFEVCGAGVPSEKKQVVRYNNGLNDFNKWFLSLGFIFSHLLHFFPFFSSATHSRGESTNSSEME